LGVGGLGVGGLGVGGLGVEGLGVGVESATSRHRDLSRAMALHIAKSSVGRSYAAGEVGALTSKTCACAAKLATRVTLLPYSKFLKYYRPIRLAAACLLFCT
jgi:hypothetical protein